jgi:hypothetical protein
MARQENGGVQAKEGSVRERTLFKNKKKLAVHFIKNKLIHSIKSKVFFKAKELFNKKIGCYLSMICDN